MSLHPQYWNEEKNEFRRSVPIEKRKILEKSLELWVSKYSDSAEQWANSDEIHDVQDIVAKVSDERKSTRKFKLLAYFDELISQFEKTGNIGNRKV